MNNIPEHLNLSNKDNLSIIPNIQNIIRERDIDVVKDKMSNTKFRPKLLPKRLRKSSLNKRLIGN